MKPPACTQCKWGTGTTCEKPKSNTSSKELEAKLKQIQEERTKQDVAWFAPPSEGTVETKKTIEVVNTNTWAK